VSALVVTWNSGRVLPTMLERLTGQLPEGDIELVLADNASSDGSADLAAEIWNGPATIIRGETNSGFAVALDTAFRAARGDYVLVLNPDAALEAGAVSRLCEELDRDPGVVAAGPRLIGRDGEPELTSSRRLPTLWSALLYGAGLGPLVAGTRADPYTYPRSAYAVARDVPALSGAAMLIRRSSLAAAGGVDTRCFMYFEDIDICARLGEHGGRIRYCPDAVAVHVGADSSPRAPQLEAWLAVQLEAALNAYFAEHRGSRAATAHRAITAFAGTLRLAAAPLAAVRSRRLAGRYLRTGAGLLGWAATGRMPHGAPADAVLP
jgi:N-acetylglucosaminyl-diphospho-decaprenol L-rhamnosyltransferase